MKAILIILDILYFSAGSIFMLTGIEEATRRIGWGHDTGLWFCWGIVLLLAAVAQVAMAKRIMARRGWLLLIGITLLGIAVGTSYYFFDYLGRGGQMVASIFLIIAGLWAIAITPFVFYLKSKF